MPAVELTDRELDAWVAEHVFRHLIHKPNPDLWYEDSPFEGEPATRLLRKFTQDRNACAQAEAKIVEMRLAEECVMALIDPEYVQENRLTFPTVKQIFGLVTASARQRCEAMWLIREKIDVANATREQEME